MKKMYLLAAVCVLSVCMAGCGNDSKNEKNKEATEYADEESMSEDDSIEDGWGIGEETLAVSDVPVTVSFGKEERLTVNVPAGFGYNSGWFCYTDQNYKTSIWVSDGSVYDSEADMANSKSFESELIKLDGGEFSVEYAQNPEGFYGAETHYYVVFNGKIDGIYGVRINVTNNDKDMSATMTEDIVAMLQTFAKK